MFPLAIYLEGEFFNWLDDFLLFQVHSYLVGWF